MDVAEFQEWSGGIAQLSRAQRRQTFQTLALSEASDSYDDDLGECREVDAVTAVSGGHTRRHAGQRRNRRCRRP